MNCNRSEQRRDARSKRLPSGWMRQAEVLPYSIRMLRNRGVLSNVDGDEAFYILDGSGTFILNDVRHPFPRTLGTGSQISITNCCCSGLSRLRAWTVFSERPAIRLACRQNSWPESRSTRSLANMGPSIDDRGRAVMSPLLALFGSSLMSELSP